MVASEIKKDSMSYLLYYNEMKKVSFNYEAFGLK